MSRVVPRSSATNDPQGPHIVHDYARWLRSGTWGLLLLLAVLWPQAPRAEETATSPPVATVPADGAAAVEGGAVAAPDGAAPTEAAPATETPAPPEGPRDVAVGLHLSDIQSIDLKSHSYMLDFYLWFRWRGDDIDPSATAEITNPYEQWAVTVTPLYETPEVLDSGELYQVVRVQGSFSRKMPVYNYPFDRQWLSVAFEDTTLESGALRYIVDEGAPSISKTVQLPGYEVGAPTLVVSEFHYPTTFGDTRLAAPGSYSRATFEVPLRRPSLPYSIKLFLPVFCVIVCAALMFLLSPTYVDSRVDVGITSLLTIVALQMTYNDNLPDVGYLMLMDKVYLCAYMFVIAGLGVVVHTTRLAESGQAQRGIVLHRRWLKALAAVWTFAMIVLVVQAWAQG